MWLETATTPSPRSPRQSRLPVEFNTGVCMYRPRTRNEWALVGTTAAQALVTTGLDLYTVLTYFGWIHPSVYEVPLSYVIPTNFAIFQLGNLYQFGLAFDALRMKNNLQLYSVCVLNACLCAMSIMRYSQSKHTAVSLQMGEALGPRPFTDRSIDWWGQVRPAYLTSTTVITLCSAISFVLVYLLQREYRWAIYRHISGSLEMLRRYFAYQILLVLIRIEVYFLMAFVILYGLIDVHYEQPEFSLTFAIIPALWIQVAMTIVFTRSENVLGAIAAVVLRLGEMAYLLSRILVLNGTGIRARTLLKDEMLLLAGTALALATFACLNAMLCIANFGKGLKPLLQNSSWKETPHEFEPVHQHRYAERIDLD